MLKVMRKNVGVFLLALVLGISVCMVSTNIFGAKAVAPESDIAPLVWYQFKDSTNLGKDTQNKYNLVKVKPDAVITSDEFGAVFNGTGGLCAADAIDNDISEKLTSFTLNFEMKPGRQTVRSTPIGFGWNDWNASKYCWLTLNQTNDATGTDKVMRFCTHDVGDCTSVGDAPSHRDWGADIGNFEEGAVYKISLSVQLSGKILVYVNNLKKYEYNVPAEWNLKDGNMRFAIGSDSVWGNCYSPYVGGIGNVTIYPFAMQESEIGAYYAKGKLTTSDMATTPTSADVDYSTTIIAENGASDAEILRSAPKTSLVPVTMSDSTKRSATVTWTNVVRKEGSTYLEGAFKDVYNPANIKAFAKIGFMMADLLNPIVKYNFSDDANIGADSAGNYDLSHSGTPVKNAEGVTLANSVMYAGYDRMGKDFTDYLKNSTISLKFKINTFSTEDWWCLFSVDDYYSESTTAGLSLMVSGTDLRIVTIDAGWWGPDFVKLALNTWYQVDLVQDLTAHKMHAYVNGELKKTIALPNDFSMTCSKNATFAFGGAYGGNNSDAAGAISQGGSITFGLVSVYDFAMNASQVSVLNSTGILKDSSLAGAKYIKTVANVPDFGADSISKTPLLDKMTTAEMLEAINSATVTATLSDASTMPVPVYWQGITKVENVWTLNGRSRMVGLGIPNSAVEISISQVLTVLPSYGVSIAECVNGTIATSASSGNANDIITITVTPATHYVIEAVTVDGTAITAVGGVYSFTLTNKDVIVAATFTPIQYNLTLGVIEHGSLTLSANKGIVGDTIQITALPNAHFTLSKLFANGKQVLPQGGKYSIIVNSDIVFTAEFIESVYTVDLVFGKNGKAVIDKTSGKVNEKVIITVTPDATYKVGTVKQNDTIVPAVDGVYSFVIQGDTEVFVTFEKITYNVAVDDKISNGTVTVDKSTASAGDIILITVTPNDKYEIEKVLVNGKEIAIKDGVYSFAVNNDNIVVSASFAKKKGCSAIVLGDFYSNAILLGMLACCGILVIFASKRKSKLG